jgi:uncharacterized protein HemY
MILPFAYAQALFADERYTEAAEALRLAMSKVTPDQEGVFYPRGLYTDEDVLFEQIDQLAEKTELYSLDSDLHLLLGYQLLGVGELDDAVVHLRLANQNMVNAEPAAALMNLLEKIRTQQTEDKD